MSKGHKAGAALARAIITQIDLMYQSNTANNFVVGFLETFYTELKTNNNLRDPPGKGSKRLLVENIFKQILEDDK